MKLNDDNFLSVGFTGKMGDMIFYQKNGRTCARRASGSYNKIPTEKQAVIRARFLAAHQFAQSVINDPVLKAAYQEKAKKGHHAYSVAVSEYMQLHRLD